MATKQISNAPEPIKHISTGGSYFHKPKPKPPTIIDWFFWRNMKVIKKHDACALALNINPDLIKISPQSWMAATGEVVILDESFPCDEVADKFNKLMRLLNSNLYDKQHFSQPFTLHLSEFVAWCVYIGLDIPAELAGLAKDAGNQADTEPASVRDDEESGKTKLTDNDRRNEIAKQWLSTKQPSFEAMTSKQILKALEGFSPDNKSLFISGGTNWLNRDHSVIPKRKAGRK